MHNNNLLWFLSVKNKYPQIFESVKVLELGSYDHLLTIRSLFNAKEYIGVDHGEDQPGIPSECGVDLNINARDTSFEPEHFDILVTASMLEHDPLWRNSLYHNFAWIKNGGHCLITFGSDGNGQHQQYWHPVPRTEYLEFIEIMGYDLLEEGFEEDIYGPDCPGGYYSHLIKRYGNESDKMRGLLLYEIDNPAPNKVI